MTLVRWNPVRDLASMEIDRLDRMFENLYGTGRGWAPAVDIYETNDREFVIKAELPEMKREQINVTFEHNVLTLSGERASEFKDNAGAIHRTERVFGSFSRSFTLPATVDGNRITAAYKDGVLTVRIPQREEAKPKQIAVGE
jgi:HSP20 family protein